MKDVIFRVLGTHVTKVVMGSSADRVCRSRGLGVKDLGGRIRIREFNLGVKR
jgi:hypothetical protein